MCGGLCAQPPCAASVCGSLSTQVLGEGASGCGLHVRPLCAAGSVRTGPCVQRPLGSSAQVSVYSTLKLALRPVPALGYKDECPCRRQVVAVRLGFCQRSAGQLQQQATGCIWPVQAAGVGEKAHADPGGHHRQDAQWLLCGPLCASVECQCHQHVQKCEAFLPSRSQLLWCACLLGLL